MKIQILKQNSSKSFKLLAGINRPVSPSHVTKLANSVNKMGIIRPVVIAELSFISGKSEKYIIDGQHLFFALIRNKQEIPYVEIEIKNQKELIEKIALLNASSKSWNLINYIEAWASLNSDYKKLNHYYNTYDIELLHLATIFSKTSNTSGGWGSMAKVIKGGNFKIVNEEIGIKLLDYLTDILKVIPRMNRQQNLYLCKEFTNFYVNNIKKYNHNTFMENLNKNKKTFILSTQEENKISELFEKLI